MTYGICIASVAPVRAEASDRAEMVTQLLFGESVEILDTQAQWIKIKADFDGYEGWIDSKMITEIPEPKAESSSTSFASDLFNLITVENVPMTITLGATLHPETGNSWQLGNKNYEFLGESEKAQENDLSVVDWAQMYLNTPYLWGGKSSFGIDCSGLVQQVYKMKGINLPRDAYQQAEFGDFLSFVEEGLPGDLAFFDNAEGKIIHVGILLDNQKIIHAHGCVRIDRIDSTGIFNVDRQEYSHKLRFIKRLF